MAKNEEKSVAEERASRAKENLVISQGMESGLELGAYCQTSRDDAEGSRNPNTRIRAFIA